MKKIENSFAVTGFIGKDAEIRSFETASVARFSIAVSRADKKMCIRDSLIRLTRHKKRNW